MPHGGYMDLFCLWMRPWLLINSTMTAIISNINFWILTLSVVWCIIKYYTYNTWFHTHSQMNFSHFLLCVSSFLFFLATKMRHVTQGDSSVSISIKYQLQFVCGNKKTDSRIDIFKSLNNCNLFVAIVSSVEDFLDSKFRYKRLKNKRIMRS